MASKQKRIHSARAIAISLGLAIIFAGLPAVQAQPAASGLILNEITASNRSGIRDAAGDTPDWIEIKNAGDAALSMAGIGLSDDPELAPGSICWLKDGDLAPGAYRIIFASGKAKLDPDGLQHCDFKLSSEGEFLALVDQDLEVLDALDPQFPAQRPDISYGREPLDGDASPGAWNYLERPSPGEANAWARPALIMDLSRNLPALAYADALPIEDQTLVITSTLLVQDTKSEEAEEESGLPELRLLVRRMFDAEQTFDMRDDGQEPDLRASDGIYSVSVPLEDLAPGEMLRWRAEVHWTQDASPSRLVDAYPDVPSQSKVEHLYHGTIRANEDPELESKLPIAHWFVEHIDAARGDAGAPTSMHFAGRFYDGIWASRRGWTTLNWDKRKFNMNLPQGERFWYSDDQLPVKEFNLQSHFKESSTPNSSYLRENLAFDFLREVGMPASHALHLQLRLNTDFYGLYSFIEEVDEIFLERNGLSLDGELFKAAGTPDRGTLQFPPDRDAYRKIHPQDADWSKLYAFTRGINGPRRHPFMMDHVDIPALINEMAAHSVMPNQDRMAKNYYIYREPEHGLWIRIPWDLDHAFAFGRVLEERRWAHPRYGNREHHQSWPNAWNRLYDALLDHPPTAEMLYRRMRSLSDAYGQARGSDPPRFAEMLETMHLQIVDEAYRDHRRWGAGSPRRGMLEISRGTIPIRRKQLVQDYGPGSKEALIPEAARKGLTPWIADYELPPDEDASDDESYLVLHNPHAEALDISGWTLSGGVEFRFAPGTVIPAGSSLYLAENLSAFRARTSGPRGGQGLFVIGDFKGRLRSGELLELSDAAGELRHQRKLSEYSILIPRVELGGL